jgi:hypothetical protein
MMDSNPRSPTSNLCSRSPVPTKFGASRAPLNGKCFGAFVRRLTAAGFGRYEEVPPGTLAPGVDLRFAGRGRHVSQGTDQRVRRPEPNCRRSGLLEQPTRCGRPGPPLRLSRTVVSARGPGG